MPKQSNCFVDPANGTVHLVGVKRRLETSLADRSPHELDASEGMPGAIVVEHLPRAHGEGHACALRSTGHMRALRQVVVSECSISYGRR